jgi:hypothetical protein
VDAGVEGDLVAAPGVVAWQAGFVAGLTWDVAAGEEEIGDACTSAWVTLLPPAVSMASSVGSGGSMATYIMMNSSRRS